MSQSPPTTRPGAGRPSRERAEQRHVELLDRALELFLDRGFELTSIDAIAASVGMTKRTVYSRYEDKKALFRATLQRAVEQWIVPRSVLQAAERGDLEASLIAIAHIRVANAVSPAGIRLQRIIDAESYRFPEIHQLAHEQSLMPSIEHLADLLSRHAAKGTIKVEKPELVAAAFLGMVMGAPARGIIWGDAIDGEVLDERIRFCVRLFLDGVRVG